MPHNKYCFKHGHYLPSFDECPACRVVENEVQLNIVERSQMQLDLGNACIEAMSQINEGGRKCTLGDMFAGLEFARMKLRDTFERAVTLIEHKGN